MYIGPDVANLHATLNVACRLAVSQAAATTVPADAGHRGVSTPHMHTCTATQHYPVTLLPLIYAPRCLLASQSLVPAS